jgi:hypothetical protein
MMLAITSVIQDVSRLVDQMTFFVVSHYGTLLRLLLLKPLF